MPKVVATTQAALHASVRIERTGAVGMRVQHSAARHERAQVVHVSPFDFAGAENAFADE